MSWRFYPLPPRLRTRWVPTVGGTAHSLAGVITGTSSASGDLKRGVLMAGATDGTSSVSGALKLGAVLAGVSNGVATVEGVLTVTTGGTSHSLAGAADGTSSVAGALKLGAVLSGESTGVAIVTGNMTAEWILAASVAGTSSATGNLLVVELGASDTSESVNFAPILYLLRKR
jgi:hypothetical protein